MSILKQSVVLTIARTLTMVVQFISPIFLTRILTPTDYGHYQEFIVYSMLAVSFVEFSIKSNILYFVPRDPSKVREYLTGTTLLNLAFTALGALAIIVFRHRLAELTHWDVTRPMLLYLVTYVNLDYLEMFWIATRRTTNVLFYGLTLAIMRTLVVVAVAHYTRDVSKVVYALIIFQTAKCLFVASYVLYKRLLAWSIDWDLIVSQMKFVIPLGGAAVILYFNNEISKVIVSSQLGAIALAMYSIGSRQVPLTGIVRSSVSDVVFPEIVRLNRDDPKQGLMLWKRTNLIQTFFIIPIFFSTFFYADVIVTTLFTREYIKAVPIFRIYLLLMLLKDGIEMGAPLRAMHRNRVFIYGNILSLAVNVGLLYLLFRVYPYYGPAAALVLTTTALQIFLAVQIMNAYEASLKQLFLWRKHVYIAGAGVLLVPVMQLGQVVFGETIVPSVIFGAVYVLLYVLAVHLLRIDEVDQLLARTAGRLRANLLRT
ncbi:MAG TPA: oligosaccharide flippase family protein [Candidatus Krumholzibacteria bacterium]|nr:oligosaccharide flippase family protein [Candidatus Krumholzibacteria bacterium]